MLRSLCTVCLRPVDFGFRGQVSAGTCSHDNGGATINWLRANFQTPGVLAEEPQADSSSSAAHLLQTTVIEKVRRGAPADCRCRAAEDEAELGRRGRCNIHKRAASPWLDGWVKLLSKSNRRVRFRGDTFESGEHVHCNIEPLSRT